MSSSPPIEATKVSSDNNQKQLGYVYTPAQINTHTQIFAYFRYSTNNEETLEGTSAVRNREKHHNLLGDDNLFGKILPE